MSDELRPDGTDRALHLEREYDATAEEVWDAWTDPARLARWLARPAAPLGRDPVRLAFGDSAEDWAEVSVLHADPPRELVLRWDFTGVQASELRVSIVDLAAGRVRVVLDHRGLGDSTVGYGAGWQAYLDMLGAELGADVGGDWDTRFAAALPVWQARAAR